MLLDWLSSASIVRVAPSYAQGRRRVPLAGLAATEASPRPVWCDPLPDRGGRGEASPRNSVYWAILGIMWSSGCFHSCTLYASRRIHAAAKLGRCRGRVGEGVGEELRAAGTSGGVPGSNFPDAQASRSSVTQPRHFLLFPPTRYSRIAKKKTYCAAKRCTGSIKIL